MGEAGRQLDLFRVYGSKIKCVILLVVTHATDMYSFGVVMADVLLSKRLDARDMPQGVTNGADAKQNMSTEQRDIIVSLLREPEYKGNSPQPSASELLRLLFLSSGPATFRRCVTFCEAISVGDRECGRVGRGSAHFIIACSAMACHIMANTTPGTRPPDFLTPH